MKSLFLLGITISAVMVSTLLPNGLTEREPLTLRKSFKMVTADFRVLAPSLRIDSATCR
jgi:hypothetical protein